ncbi:dihydrofolate reductase family protein [Streptococcus hongkongensis]|nr:diadenosine tetraphosphate hydrolase [Streptococcus uberis]
MRQLVLNIAMSLDGFIAKEDGTYDWIDGHGTDQFDTPLQFDNPDFFASCDTIIMGRKAYDDCPLEMIDGHEQKQFYVATHQDRLSDRPNLHFTSTVLDDIKALKAEEGGPIWLFGGADLVQLMIDNDMIDQYIIGIIPTILGQGRPLFKGNDQEHKLQLIESTITDGIAMLRYIKR